MKKNELHKLANALREMANRVETTKREKCASVLVAAAGLNILQRKIGA